MVSKDKCTVICTVACSVVDAFINSEPDPDQYPDPAFLKFKNLLLKKLDLILKHCSS
jgi:hypothetical protein